MPLFIDTTREKSMAIAICDRCKMKRKIAHLVSDPNARGLRVCKDTCVDQYDPYRLAARSPDKTVVQYPRPEVPLTD